MSEGVENRYHHSKLYKLIDQVEGFYYIGSTACTTLSKRYTWHKQDAKKTKHKDSRKYSYFNLVGWENVKIILLSEHKFENKNELLREEDKLIQECRSDTKCLNVLRAYMTDEDKKKYIEEYNKKYRNEHHEEIKAKKMKRTK